MLEMMTVSAVIYYLIFWIVLKIKTDILFEKKNGSDYCVAKFFVEEIIIHSLSTRTNFQE